MFNITKNLIRVLYEDIEIKLKKLYNSELLLVYRTIYNVNDKISMPRIYGIRSKSIETYEKKGENSGPY